KIGLVYGLGGETGGQARPWGLAELWGGGLAPPASAVHEPKNLRPRHYRQHDTRRPRAAVKYALHRRPAYTFARKITPGVQVAVKPGKGATRNFHTDAETLGKHVTRGA